MLSIQVSTFGCEAFALLFDDIDPELSESDRSAFQSFGLAQVSVSNEIYEHLHEPKLFLFCPTGMLLLQEIYFAFFFFLEKDLWPFLI